MALDGTPVHLAVLGPPDLLVTAVVAGLATCGLEAERLSRHDVLSVTAPFPRGGPGLLVIDVDTRHSAGAVQEATRAGLTVLAIGSDSNRERAAAAIAAGAAGWVAKSSSLETLAKTVRAAAAGRLMSEDERAEWLAEHRDTKESMRAAVERLEQLSPREREVIRHLADGLRAAEIAEVLFLSITTVRSHIRAILLKLGVKTQQHAADVYRDTSRRLGRILGMGTDS